MAQKPYTYLITGASRGIGFGLVETLAKRPDTVVFAAIRDIAKRDAVEKINNNAAKGSKVVAVQIRAGNVEDHETLPATLSQSGVDRLDVVVANAGISNYYGPAVTTPLDQFRDHFEINAIGMITLFQAVWPFLDRSEAPKFIYISTAVASMGRPFPLLSTAYGSSKAAGNFIISKIHQEHPKLITFALNPGWVQTDMGNLGARSAGLDAAPETLEGSVSGILNRIDEATHEKDGGKFKDYKEGDIPW